MKKRGQRFEANNEKYNNIDFYSNTFRIDKYFFFFFNTYKYCCITYTNMINDLHVIILSLALLIKNFHYLI